MYQHSTNSVEYIYVSVFTVEISSNFSCKYSSIKHIVYQTICFYPLCNVYISLENKFFTSFLI